MSSNFTKFNKPPALPPKKIAPDPDYEVIEFSNEQYSNAQPIKAQNGKTLEALKCELCGSMTATVKCDHCNEQLFCSSCDDMFHRHPKRNTHIRKAIFIQSDVKPPLPPKGEMHMPVAPPRRKKTGMTPMPTRKFDREMPIMQRPQAPPSPALSLRERVSSIRRLIVPGGKNSTKTPPEKENSQSSIFSAESASQQRPQTPNSDTSTKLPSLAMERIKIHTNNARDRMEIMQKRYHEYQESMKNDNGSHSALNCLPSEQQIINENRNASSRSDSFGVRLRSGSLSNFANQMNKHNNNGRFSSNQNDFDETTQDEGSLSDTRSRAFSSSVHDLSFGRNNPNNYQKQHSQQQFAAPFGYMPNHYHGHMQPNCMNCSQQQLWNPQMLEPQWNAKNLNGSNMSLNLPQAGFYPQPFGTTWMNNGSYQKPDPYSLPFGMIPYNSGYSHPLSRPHSRNPSRAASPTLSTKSRKSSISTRNGSYRHSYIAPQLTDDESSDSMGYVDDLNREKLNRRFCVERSMRPKHVMQLSPPRSYDEESEAFSRRKQQGHGRRASSSARSISRSRSERRPSQGVRSDSTQDSDVEFGTRALVQAKIREKIALASSMDESSVENSKSKATQKDPKKTIVQPVSKVNGIEKHLLTKTERKIVNQNVQKSSSTVQTEAPKKMETAPKTLGMPKGDDVNGESEADLIQTLEDDAPSGPPPSTPDYEWECEFCTFTNEPKTKICAICCKTPTTKATRKTMEESKPAIRGQANEQAEISKEGFWVVSSSSEDDVCEVQSHGSNAEEIERESEKDISNDLEVMNILSQIERINGTHQAENDIIIIEDSSGSRENAFADKDADEPDPSIAFINQNTENRIKLDDKVQNNTIYSEAILTKNEMRTQTMANTSESPIQRQSNPTNESRKPFDDQLLAYIDQSLKTLIGANSNNNSPIQNTAIPYLPSPVFMNNTVPSMQIPRMAFNSNIAGQTFNDMHLYKVLLGANNYSYDEIQVALSSCSDADPITWLNDNWQKLIETVQTLSTKYGQEHKENIVGTISPIEARNALKKHKGNVWHAVTECIENRQSAFNAIKSQGNFSLEDIVTYLTAHNGHLEKALEELNRVQMKPFLLKILNSPATQEIEAPPKVREIELTTPSVLDEPSPIASEHESQTTTDPTTGKNVEKNILKDIEAIIGSMEEKQSKQTESLLKTIEALVGNLNTSQISRPMSSASSFSVASSERIDMKSPIVVPSRSSNNGESNSDVESDVKDFVSRHIQDIVPDVAALMNKELTENSTHIQRSAELHQQSSDEQLTAPDAPDAQETDFEHSVANKKSTSSAIQSHEPVLNDSQFVEQIPSKPERTPINNGAKFTVNSLYPRFTRNQMGKKRIRKLEKQLKKRQRRQSVMEFDQFRSDSQNTGYLTDATITPDMMDDPQTIENIAVSNEKTFSLSIIEQAIVDNNKEQPAIEPDLIAQPGNVDISNEKDLKSRNLSELVEDTKNLIQQMKFEINEDIAMSASEFEFDEDDLDVYIDESSFESEYSDSWEDIDDDEEEASEKNNFSDHSEMELFETENQNEEHYERSSQSIESEYLSEFNEHLINREEQNLGAEMSVKKLLPNENIASETEDNVTNDENLIAKEPSNIEIAPSSSSGNEDILTGHMIEIQQSLHASNVVSLSIREDVNSSNREKSASVEPTEVLLRSESVEKSNSVIFREENGFEKIDENGDNGEVIGDANTEQLTMDNQNFDGQEITNFEDNNDSNEQIIIIPSSPHENVVASDEKSHTEPTEEIQNSHESQNTSLNENISEQSDLEANESKEELGTGNNEMFSKSASSQEIAEESVMNLNDTGSELDELSADISHASVSTTDESTHSSVSLAPSETLIESFKYKKITVPVVTQCSQSSRNVMQLKKIELTNKSTHPINPHIHTSKNKIPVRRPSIGEPSPSIRNIQNELMNRQLRQPPLKISKKPSKIVPPKLFFNKSTFGAQESNIQSNNAADATKRPYDEVPSTSSGHQSIPKKKYYETCFSDDYQTSDDESRPASSKKVIPNLVKILEKNPDESFDVDVMADRLLQDGNVQSHSDAMIAANLIQMKFSEDKAVWAATQCETIEEALDILQQECELCMEIFPMNRIVFMLKCEHSCCEDCARNYFTIQITDRSITDCTCPFCKLPDLNAGETTEDDALEYFSNMDIQLKSILDVTVHELFQRKLRDRTLMQDPNFKWCIQCSSGFFARPRQKKLICPDCGSITCARCRRTWEPQHEGISCEQFSEWKDSNDPENQAQGVANHLQLHGISCPKCKFKYSLTRGGCMHFTCTQCKYEFCYGCNKPFKMGAKCKVSDYCAKLGLHSHHPRNCLFYLRDKEPSDLQTLLRMHNVSFNTDPLDFGVQPESSEDSAAHRKLCPMPIQRETPGGFIDTVCKGDIEENSAGLCRTHFVEYLVFLVAKANIDPLPILDLTDCVQELRRSGIALPDRGPWDTDPIYRDMCSKIVEKHIPLD